MCPEVFEMGQNELAHVKADPVPAEAEQTGQTAADDCPVGAIKIER